LYSQLDKKLVNALYLLHGVLHVIRQVATGKGVSIHRILSIKIMNVVEGGCELNT